MATALSANPLREQALSIPQLIEEQVWRLEDALRKVIPTRVQHAARQIVLTGSGDSAMAGRAAEQAFRSFAGVPTVALEAMEASRYLLPCYANQYPHTPMLFAVSNSGEVARVVEAAGRAREVGGYVVGITGHPGSSLGRLSDAVVDTTAPAFTPSPGMRSYVMALLTLELFAIRLAEVRGRITMDEAQALRGEIADTGRRLGEVIDEADAALRTATTAWRDLQGVEFLGSGPGRATAAFGTAKILEAVGKQSSHIDIEEFVHLNYFERAADSIATVLVSPHGSAASSRADEVAGLLNSLGRPWLALGTVTGAPVQITLPAVREEFSPIVDAAIAGLLAAHLQDVTGEVEGRGATGRWAACAGGLTTRNSQIHPLNA